MAQATIGRKVSFAGDIIRTVYDSDSFAVYALNVPEDVVVGKGLKRSKFGNVTVCGNISGLQEGVMYDFSAVEKQTKHGYSYEIQKCTGSTDDSGENMLLFLRSILTDNQAFELLKSYPNIVELVIQGRTDEVDLNRLHGIKEYTFDLVKNKIIENHDNIDLLSFFGGAVSLKVIAKIREKYPSIDSVKKLFKKDPYKFLMEFQGIAFSKADKILLDMQKEQEVFDYDLKTSAQRCLAFIKYKIESEAEDNGSTRYSLMQLKKDVDREVPACAAHFTECLKNEAIWYDASNLLVSLDYVRNMEQYNANTIREGLDNPVVWDINVEKYRKVDGLELTDEQVSGLKKLCENNVSVLNGPAGCVDCDTEFFTGTEWKRIADYKEGDMVLQYNKDGSANLIHPERYIKQRANMLYHFETKYGLDQTLSLGHNVYYITSRGHLKCRSFADIINMHNRHGFQGKFITTFNYYGGGISLSEYEIRLAVAVFADGSFVKNGMNHNSKAYGRVRMILKKARKKRRIEGLLMVTGTEYRKRDMRGTKEGYTEYYFKAPVVTKHFPKEWYGCSKKQFEIIAHEVTRWDGNFREHNSYTTTNKEDADFIQFVFSVTGKRATIKTFDRRGRVREIDGKQYITDSIDYEVNATKRVFSKMCYDKRASHLKTEISEYKTKDGYEYCFTVPSGMLVLRRNDKIFITGNCGKSQTLTSVINMLEDNKKTYLLMSPTARAARVLKQYTGRNASTIHRGYGYSPSEGWKINSGNLLNVDALIIDESSMIGVNLMYHVLQGLDLTRTKLLLVGDSAQLSSVDAGNVLHDIINSGVVPVISLTKIFRYDDGGLARVATDIRTCKNYLPGDVASHKTLNYGKEKDYSFVVSTDEAIVNEVTIIYKRLLDSGKSLDDIQIITAYNVGKTGTQAISQSIQRAINKNYGSRKTIRFGDISFYEGDLVIQKKNNYTTAVYDMSLGKLTGEEKLVCNGDVGTIVEIKNDYEAVIRFDDICYLYQKAQFSEVKLGYAISVHSSQGSQVDTVIFVTPKNQAFMMSSNLLYVGCTRSKKRCIHIGDPYMVSKAVEKKEEIRRNTFLCEFLQSDNRKHIDSTQG